jgi:hypothetical protein
MRFGLGGGIDERPQYCSIATAEPVLAKLRHHRGMRRFTLRGQAKHSGFVLPGAPWCTTSRRLPLARVLIDASGAFGVQSMRINTPKPRHETTTATGSIQRRYRCRKTGQCPVSLGGRIHFRSAAAPVRTPLSLDPAVGRARAGCHRVGWQGAKHSDGLGHREHSQRRQRARGRLDRACSVVTQWVNVFVGLQRTIYAAVHANRERSTAGSRLRQGTQ